MNQKEDIIFIKAGKLYATKKITNPEEVHGPINVESIPYPNNIALSNKKVSKYDVIAPPPERKDSIL